MNEMTSLYKTLVFAVDICGFLTTGTVLIMLLISYSL